jgi:hypothetical protein
VARPRLVVSQAPARMLMTAPLSWLLIDQHIRQPGVGLCPR